MRHLLPWIYFSHFFSTVLCIFSCCPWPQERTHQWTLQTHQTVSLKSCSITLLSYSSPKIPAANMPAVSCGCCLSQRLPVPVLLSCLYRSDLVLRLSGSWFGWFSCGFPAFCTKRLRHDHKKWWWWRQWWCPHLHNRWFAVVCLLLDVPLSTGLRFLREGISWTPVSPTLSHH